ncbi:MAG: hypothetical protein IJK78_11840 [Bacteroidales bacterium]|nr:hypothetical protein [Bacteroidales bacterium]
MEYLYIQQTKKKVALVSEGDKWIWEIDGKEYILNPAIERLLAYHVYTGAYSSFFELLRINLPKKVNMSYSPEFLRTSFEEQHPCESIDVYSRDMIPAYADPKSGMWLSSDGNTGFWITAMDEQMILSDIKERQFPLSFCKTRIKNAASRYGLRLDDEAVSNAVNSFMTQHGLSTGRLIYEEKCGKEVTSKKQKNPIKDGVTPPNGAVIAVGFIVMALLALYWGVTFSGTNIGVALIPLVLLAFAISFEGAGVGNIRKFCAIQYIALFSANAITALLAIIFEWGRKEGLFSGGSEPTVAGFFSLLFSLPCLLFSIVFYGDVKNPGSVKNFPWWYFGIK